MPAPPPPRSTTRTAYDPAAVRRGDHAAFERLVEQETPRLYRMVVRIVADDDEARSVVQETFLQAYRRLDTFRGEAKLSTWLIAIGLNLARAALRRARRAASLDEADIERLQPRFDGDRYAERYEPWSPLDHTERSERVRLVHAALERLPETYRTVIVLRDIEQLSTAEAAAVLGLTPGALRVRLHRARQALRALLAPYFA